MKKQIKGSLCLLLATIIWGFAFIAQSVGMDKIGPFTFQAVRCAMAVLFLILCSFLMEFKSCGAQETVKRWLNPSLWRVGLICGSALFIAASLQQVGLLYTDAGKAGFLTAMYIVWVPVLGIFLGKKPPVTIVLSVAMAVIGLYLLSCIGVSQINKGDLLLIGCALAFAVQITCIDRLAGNFDGLRLSCIQALVVTVFSIPFVIFTETPSWVNIIASWKPLCFAGILSMGVAYTMQVVGQKSLEPTAASLIMSLESVFAVLGGWWLLGETMTIWETTGCVLVFDAVMRSQLPAGLFRKKA